MIGEASRLGYPVQIHGPHVASGGSDARPSAAPFSRTDTSSHRRRRCPSGSRSSAPEPQGRLAGGETKATPFPASSRCFSSTSFIWNTSRSSASPAGPGAPPPSSAGIVDAVVACYLRQRESNRAETRGKVSVESGYAACSTWDFEDDNHDYGCTRLGEHSKRQLGQGD